MSSRSREKMTKVATPLAAAIGGAAVGSAAGSFLRGRKTRRNDQLAQRFILAANDRADRAESARSIAEKENKELRYKVTHDSLTGALTKEAIKGNAQELKKAGIPFGIFMMDWDAFKRINDEIGHEEADEMLGDFGPYFAQNFRREGETIAHERLFRQPERAEGIDQLLGRYGGDEFVLVVNLSDRGRNDGLTPEERMAKAGQHLESITDNFVKLQDQSIRDLDYGISIGGAICLPGRPMTISDVFKEADGALRLSREARGAPSR